MFEKLFECDELRLLLLGFESPSFDSNKTLKISIIFLS